MLHFLARRDWIVRQHPEYGARLSPPVRAKRWDDRCDNAHLRLRKILRKLKKDGQIVQTRVVEEPIDFILDSPHPIHFLFELSDLMEADLPATSAKYKRAMAYRDMFLSRFITANPLRIKHFAAMTWRADNTGNLYQDQNKKWWLRFPKDAFKNRKILKKDSNVKDYKVKIAPSLVPYIEEYLFEYRPLLLGADRCDYVFTPGPRGGCLKHKTSDVKPIGSTSLSKILHDKARYYLHCMGFGPHAYRHIIANYYIKNHENGIMVAASILHDKPETVLKYYGHLQHADFFNRWIDYHESQLEISRANRLREAA